MEHSYSRKDENSYDNTETTLEFKLNPIRRRFLQEGSFFDKDYFENGKNKNKSLYSNYRWLPELTKPMVAALCAYTKIQANDTVLDFGCARGYVVRALVEMNINAFGLDVSEYAISNGDETVRNRLHLFKNQFFTSVADDIGISGIDWMIAKDVFEHIAPDNLHSILSGARKFVRKIYVLVPLGDDGIYRIPDYDLDASHIIAENEDWWISFFENCGLVVEEFRFEIPGVKREALKLHQRGNGHFILSSK